MIFDKRQIAIYQIVQAYLNTKYSIQYKTN